MSFAWAGVFMSNKACSAIGETPDSAPLHPGYMVRKRTLRTFASFVPSW